MLFEFKNSDYFDMNSDYFNLNKVNMNNQNYV